MATLAQGQAVKLHCAISQEITVTPSTGGRATISANGPGNVSYAQKTISAAETFGPYLSDTDVVIAAVAGSLSYDLGTASVVDGAGKLFTTNRVRNIATLGDSINEAGTNNTGAGMNTLDRGIVPWMLCYLGWPWNYEPEDNFAIGGTTLSAVIDNQLPLLQAASVTKHYQRVFVSAGTNDNNNVGTTIEDVKANFLTLFAGIRDIGAIPVVWSVLPRGIDGTITIPKQKNQQINEWLYLLSLAGLCEYVDIGENLADNSTAYGNALTTMMRDSGTSNLHPNAKGANLLGRSMAAYYTARGVGPALKFATQQGDQFDRIYNPAGVAFKLANPLLQGGTTTPTGMNTAGGTWSNVSRTLANGQTRSDRQCVLAASVNHYLYDDWTATGGAGWQSTELQPGDVIEGRAYVEIAAGVNISNIKLQLTENDGGTSRDNSGLGQIDAALSNGEYALWLKTPRITIRPYFGSGNALIYQRLSVLTAAGGSGTALVKAFEVRKVG